MNIDLWEECIKFHGHECPGLAIGFRASEIAKEEMNLSFSQDEEIVCITENDACGIDAIQYITGCTIGKGNLILKDRGKMAYTFMDRKTKTGIRLILQPIDEKIEDKKNYILQGPRDQVFKIEKSNIALPEKAKKLATIICQECKEGAGEHRIRLQDGKKVCLDCFKEYSRGW